MIVENQMNHMSYYHLIFLKANWLYALCPFYIPIKIHILETKGVLSLS